MEEVIMRINTVFYSKIFIIYFLCGFCIPCVFSQDEIYGDSFIKRIEYNFIDNRDTLGYQCNFDSKSDIEKLFFGDFNAPIEFLYAPSFEASTKGEAGFRINRDSLNTSYILEVKHISNYEEVVRECDNKYPVKGISADIMHSMPLDSIPLDSNELIWKQIHEERLKLYMVETLSYNVSDQFVEKLHQKMVSFINNFKAKGRQSIGSDGYAVTFRNVVDDEVWSLNIYMPQGNALKLSNFCKQIMEDVNAGKLNESIYISILDGFDF